MKNRSGYVIGFMGGGFALLALLAMVFGLLPAPQALAQGAEQLRPLLDRIQRLERDIRTLNLQVSRGPGAVASSPADTRGGTLEGNQNLGIGTVSAIARLEVRLSNLEDDLRATTGSIEEVLFKVTQVTRRLDKLVSDVDYRLSTLEGTRGGPVNVDPSSSTGTRVISGSAPPASVQVAAPSQPGVLGQISDRDLKSANAAGAGTGPAQPPLPAARVAAIPPKVATAPGAVLPDGTPQERYKYARGLLLKNDFDGAEVAFKMFIEQHGDHPLAANAMYWLGETFYVRDQYAQAAKVFLQGYKANATGYKAPDTLLKLGMALAKLDKKKEACSTFAKLSMDFPKLSGGLTATLRRQQKKTGCT